MKDNKCHVLPISPRTGEYNKELIRGLDGDSAMLWEVMGRITGLIRSARALQRFKRNSSYWMENKP
jgi:hypothetical protein